MSIERVREHFGKYGITDKLQIRETSCATVPLAAETLGVAEGRICKTLSFKNKATGECVLIQLAGDAKVNNGKFKRAFGYKPTMLTSEEVVSRIGHEIGGVCAFGVADPTVGIYCDESLKRFETVFPACGGHNAIAEFTPEELYRYSEAQGWVDVSKLPEVEE